MKTFLRSILALVYLASCSEPSFAQTVGTVSQTTGITQSICRIGDGGGAAQRLYGVGSPTGRCGKPVAGLEVSVVDAASKGDCTTGGGSIETTCVYNPEVVGANKWESPAPGGSGSGVSVDGSTVSSANFIDGTDITFNASGSNITASIPDVINYGGKTSLEIPNGASPATDATGEIAVDDNAWASGRGAVQVFDGTANTLLVGTLSSDTPTNGQVPKWNTGGTITWEDDGGGAGGTPDDNSVTTAKVLDGTLLPTDMDSSVGGVSWGFFSMYDFLGAVINPGSIQTGALEDHAVTPAKMGSILSDRIIGRDSINLGDAEQLTVSGGLEFTGAGGIQRSALSGDVVAAAGSGTTTIQANSVALGTDTTGNYALGDAEGGAATTGDSATAFFSSGQIERARGGTGADTSAYGAGLFGSDGSNATIDVDTIAELETALGGTNVIASTEIDTVTEINALTTDDDFATLTGTQTLTNKTLTSPNIGVAGVQLSGDGDGAITFLGLGDGADENLTINLDDTADTATVTSSTGLTSIDLSGITIPGADILTTAATGISATTADGAITELANEKANTADILTSSQVWRADAATSWTSGAVTASDGTYLNLSGVNASSTTEGLRLPQATSCASATAEGQVCWDTDDDGLSIGNGTTAADILTSSHVWRADAATSWTSGAVTASDGTFLNLSAVNASSTTEGLKLPQATSCASATAEGQTCWDTDNNMLFIGDGTTALPAGMEVLTWSYYNTSSVTTTIFGSDDLMGIGSASTLTRNTTQTIRYTENLIPLGATNAQAFVHKLQCNLAPIGSSSWDSGSDSLALQVIEMDAASATAMTTVGSAATLSGSVSVAPNPFLSGNVITSTINAFTTLTGAAHYIGINPVLTDANASVVGFVINCQVWLKRSI